MIPLHLRELEADAIITRTAYPEIPKVEHELTALDQPLAPAD